LGDERVEGGDGVEAFDGGVYEGADGGEVRPECGGDGVDVGGEVFGERGAGVGVRVEGLGVESVAVEA
jgi:hypothetical protein